MSISLRLSCPHLDEDLEAGTVVVKLKNLKGIRIDKYINKYFFLLIEEVKDFNQNHTIRI